MYLGSLGQIPPGPFNANNYLAEYQAIIDRFFAGVATMDLGPVLRHGIAYCQQLGPQLGERVYYKFAGSPGFSVGGQPDNSVYYQVLGVGMWAPATNMTEATTNVRAMGAGIRRVYGANGGKSRAVRLCEALDWAQTGAVPPPPSAPPPPSGYTPTVPGPPPVLYGQPTSSKPGPGQGVLTLAPSGSGAPTTRDPLELGTTYETVREAVDVAGTLVAAGALLLLLAGRKKKGRR